MSSAIIKDKNGVVTEFDTVATSDGTYGYPVSMDIAHHKVHESKHFVCHDYDNNVDIAAAKEWLIKVPASGKFHLIFEAVSSKNGVLELFEGTTVSADGTGLTCYNSDRNSATTSTLPIYSGPTVTGDGNAIDGEVMGTDGTTPQGNAGGGGDREHEWILKNSTNYMIRYTTLTDDNRVSLNIRYYEV